jgi:uncharacterized SAM-binding protein YcdF (DUF218 family)
LAPFAHRRRFRPIRAAFHALLLIAILWLAGFVWYAGQITNATPGPDSPLDETKADAVVVLTGTQDRLGVGFELLAQGHAQRMFISGVYRGVDVQQILRTLRRSPREAENAISLGYGADDTIGNARETAEWITKENLASLILVTSNFHMPRALLEFHAAMPDVIIVPHATASPSFKIEAWWRWPGTIRLIASEWTKYVAARVGLASGVRITVRPAISLTPQELPIAPSKAPTSDVPHESSPENPDNAAPPDAAPPDATPENPR